MPYDVSDMLRHLASPLPHLRTKVLGSACPIPQFSPAKLYDRAVALLKFTQDPLMSGAVDARFTERIAQLLGCGKVLHGIRDAREGVMDLGQLLFAYIQGAREQGHRTGRRGGDFTIGIRDIRDIWELRS